MPSSYVAMAAKSQRSRAFGGEGGGKVVVFYQHADGSTTVAEGQVDDAQVLEGRGPAHLSHVRHSHESVATTTKVTPGDTVVVRPVGVFEAGGTHPPG